MSNIVITNAGLAALVNAEHSGTNPVKIATVQFGTGKYTATANQTALKSSFKTLTTIKGAAVGDNVIHVEVCDTSTQTYTVYEYGLFLEDGTLFGVYSQTSPILSKAAGSSALLAIDCVVQGATAQTIQFSDISFSNPIATTTTSGVVELATASEVQTGTDTVRAVTPAGLSSRTATVSRTGLVELATTAEVQAGTDTTRAVTPNTLAQCTATESRAGVVELASDAEVTAGTDNTRAVTPKKANLLLANYGLGGGVNVAGTATVSGSYGTNDLNDIDRTGIYTVSASKNSQASASLVFHGERFYRAGFSAFQLMPTAAGLQYRHRSGDGEGPAWSDWKQFIWQGEDSIISGKRTFTSDLYLRKTSPQVIFQNTGVEKGTAPSAVSHWVVAFGDANGANTINRLGYFGNTLNTDGSNKLRLVSYKPIAESTESVELSIGYNSSQEPEAKIGCNTQVFGTVTAASPEASANNKQLATTEWVKTSVSQSISQAISQGIPAGTLIHFAGKTIPKGYLLCNGAAVSRTTYANLFAAIGTLYGAGDGSTTFNLPNAHHLFLEATTTAPEVGQNVEAGLPNIPATFSLRHGARAEGSETGAISHAFIESATFNPISIDFSSQKDESLYTLNANKVSVVYKNEEVTVQPKSFRTILLIRF